MQVGVKSDELPASWEGAVSGWVDGDGDIRVEDLDTPYGRQLWDTYHLIGDVLRSDDLAVKPSDLFYARISKAIDAEPPIVAPRRRVPPMARVGLSGLAVAAAVASVIWVAYPYLAGQPEDTGTLQVATAADDAGVSDYVEAHRQFAGVNPIRQVSFDAGVAP